MSFPSTLHLYPVLDLLLAKVPSAWRSDVRLGLQEALVNAAKHGNQLDPQKKVSIRFVNRHDGYCWIISDQGSGFMPSPCLSQPWEDSQIPTGDQECGRGLFILHYIFDQVQWNDQGTELTLYKRHSPKTRWLSLIPLGLFM